MKRAGRLAESKWLDRNIRENVQNEGEGSGVGRKGRVDESS